MAEHESLEFGKADFVLLDNVSMLEELMANLKLSEPLEKEREILEERADGRREILKNLIDQPRDLCAISTNRNQEEQTTLEGMISFITEDLQKIREDAQSVHQYLTGQTYNVLLEEETWKLQEEMTKKDELIKELREREVVRRGLQEELRGREEELKGREEELKGREEELKGREEKLKGREEELKRLVEEVEQLKKENMLKNVQTLTEMQHLKEKQLVSKEEEENHVVKKRRRLRGEEEETKGDAQDRSAHPMMTRRRYKLQSRKRSSSELEGAVFSEKKNNNKENIQEDGSGLQMIEEHLWNSPSGPTGPGPSYSSKKRPWSSGEKRAIHQYLADFIDKKKVPRKKDCVTCINKSSPMLRKRTWIDVKHFVHNENRRKNPT